MCVSMSNTDDADVGQGEVGFVKPESVVIQFMCHSLWQAGSEQAAESVPPVADFFGKQTGSRRS
jgi:hypothetical protein